MDEMQKAFYEVMHKYEKSFGEKGVTAILNDWRYAKAGLATIMRAHPDWDEDAKAIVFRFNGGRTIEQDVVDEAAFSMYEIALELLSGDALSRFSTALDAAKSEYSSTLTEDTLAIIRESTQINCVTGQKTSRIIGKFCRQFGLDKHERFNKVYAALADSLNPLTIEKTALLSVHPCDFLEMSNKDNEWHSCHKLNAGKYQSGCLSYMCDEVSMVFYIVDNNVKDHFYRYPKIHREMFFFKDGYLFQSRLYPQDYYEPMDQYRGIVQKAMATCLNKPNLWIFKEKRSEFFKHLLTADNSTHYADYDYHGNLSILRGSSNDVFMTIGSQPRCVCCGEHFTNPREIKCDYCTHTVVCKDCGQTVPRRDSIYTDAFYCKSCAHICAACGTQTHGTMYPVINKRGELIAVCEDCHAAAQSICSACRVQHICSAMKSIILCPHTSLKPEESEVPA